MELVKGKVEVELRGILSEEEFDNLSNNLKKRYSYERDNKKTLFYVTTGFILKIETKKELDTFFLIVKNGDETKNILEEIEVKLNISDLPKMIKILEILGYSKVNIVEQRRTNYFLEDNIVLSLKYTNDWGYHFEIEKMVKLFEAEKTKKKLADKCGFFNIKFMDGIEIAGKINEINKKHGFI
ncbi:MAG: CYTH domain-containing protein [Bacteroidota bacterium]